MKRLVEPLLRPFYLLYRRWYWTEDEIALVRLEAERQRLILFGPGVVSENETPRVPSDPSNGASAEGNEAAAGVSYAAPVVTETADKAAPGEGNKPDAGAVHPGPEYFEGRPERRPS